ncbi:MAG: hypothetical protein HY653_09160, partial [Acidobacteria bacterium]|nr:hypothetical protein [Acidobacteriota bacterium]
MSLVHSSSNGLRRVVSSLSLVFWLYLSLLAVTLPSALALRGILKQAIGPSLVHENLRTGFDLAWHGEFAFERDGLADTFGPSVVGILPVLNNLE